MNTLKNLFWILLLLPLFGVAQVSKDSNLYKEILATDTALFESYNTCDLETHASLISEDLEFYHDKGGLATSKDEYMTSMKANICGKVERILTPDTFEVHEIKDFGAIALGKHSFHNLNEDSYSKPSKFITIFKKTNKKWIITRVISLH
ncbi:nuclear transport factor 2 family protein [uncultured Dokdonia sp.]|uniref:nuclear transport factor 2 family protein n=1 Tax=uncultured Dokdonia sp. TaxID=575653 RepID=UPI0030EC8E98|tara:strand:- start:35627 stop:36073 length:447 start_codon:yes stop_codon:yes gene_type:complete